MAGGEETVRVRIEMDAGRLELELYPSRAPLMLLLPLFPGGGELVQGTVLRCPGELLRWPARGP